MSRIQNNIGFGRRALAGVGAGLLLTLGACVENPPGNFTRSIYRANPSAVQQDLFFQPNSPQLARGEAERINAQLQALVLRPQDDVVVYMNSTGSEVLDVRRAAVARSAVSRTPARVRIVRRPGFTLASPRKDAALVEVVRYSEVRVICPNQGEDFADDVYNRNELLMGCVNSTNIAYMADNVRDLTAPERLEGSDAITAAAAVDRYRADQVKQPVQMSISGGN